MIAPWASDEMAAADFGDERLDARASLVLSALGRRPNLSIPTACGGRAEMQAAYRFFDNDKVTFDKVMAPHVERSRERVAVQQVALLIQDTSEIDLTRPEQQVAGAGDLDGSRRGVLLHEMQAFTPDGIPLGTVWAEILNRTEGVSHASAAEKREQRKQLPIEEKESFRWLTGLRQARALAQHLPGTECICIGDSEADIYELFAEPRGERPLHWLIRACQDRALEGQTQHVREQVLSTAVLYEVDLLIRGRKAKTAAEDRCRRQNRETRQAQVQVRAATVTLRPPPRPDRKLAPITVNVVLVREANPPPGETPVEWILVTTLPIDAAEQVRKVVEYYCVRWSIEGLFRTDKRTLGKVKLMNRSVCQVHREAEGSLLAVQLLLAHGALAVPAHEPCGTVLPAARHVLLEIRAEIRNVTGMYLGPRQQQSYRERLRHARTDRRGKRKNKVRCAWPARAPHKPPKPPRIQRMGTNLEDLLQHHLESK